MSAERREGVQDGLSMKQSKSDRVRMGNGACNKGEVLRLEVPWKSLREGEKNGHLGNGKVL